MNSNADSVGLASDPISVERPHVFVRSRATDTIAPIRVPAAAFTISNFIKSDGLRFKSAMNVISEAFEGLECQRTRGGRYSR